MRINTKVLYLCITVVCIYLGTGCGNTSEKQVSKDIASKLKDDFFLQDVIELSHNYDDRKKAQSYFNEIKGFLFTGTKQQQGMTVDGYMPHELKNVIGFSLFFYGQQEKFVMAYVTVNPLINDQIRELINKSLNQTEALPQKGISPNAKLYFLGLHPLGPTKVMKIIIREEVINPVTMNKGPVYSIGYAISDI